MSYDSDNWFYNLFINEVKNAGRTGSTGGTIHDLLDLIGAEMLFYGRKTLVEIPESILSYNYTENVTNMNSMFYDCNALTSVPLFNTQNVTNMNSMFSGCNALTSVPLFNTQNVTNMNSMFQKCYSLTAVPLLDTKKVTNMGSMFRYCTALTSVPSLDMRSVTGTYSMFSECSSLTECKVINIPYNVDVSSSTLITVDSLVHLAKQLLFRQGSTYYLTIGQTNLDKISSMYVKLVDVTEDMKLEDDLIEKKYPFEICDSGDEGAMLITDYVKTKGWELK